MTSDNRSSAEIERDIEEERERLRENLESLQDTFSPETIVREIGNQFRNHGGDISRSIANSVKDNPVALTLTGIGLAWMIFGGRSYSRDSIDYRERERHFAGYDDDAGYDGDRPGSRPLSRGSRRSRTDFGETAWAIRDHDADFDDDDDDNGLGARVADATQAAGSAASSARRKTSKAISEGTEAVADAGRRTAGAVRDSAAEAQRRASRFYKRLAAGTEDLSEAARERVVAARREAVIARERLRYQARNQAENAADLYNRQPLVAGALAVAVGAAVGAALPRTDTEDEMMGEQSDALFGEAERIYREERDKAARVAEATVDEAKAVVRDAKRELDDRAPGGKTAAGAVRSKAKSAAKRVAKKAASKAKDERLGSPKTSRT